VETGYKGGLRQAVTESIYHSPKYSDIPGIWERNLPLQPALDDAMMIANLIPRGA